MDGESLQSAGAGDGIKEVLDVGEVFLGNLGKIGAFWEPEAEEAVGVFD